MQFYFFKTPLFTGILKYRSLKSFTINSFINIATLIVNKYRGFRHILMYNFASSFLARTVQFLKNNNISVKQLLQFIPEELLADLAQETRVDYQVKKTFGKNFFYLLLYGLLETTRVSQRSLEDVFKSGKFKFLFNLADQKNFKHNTISTRLANINCVFFEKIYHYTYELFSNEFSTQDAAKYKITRVDSTMVCETANKLAEGMTVGKKKNGKKQIKYTISLTDMFPSSVEVFSKQSELSEDLTIPKVVLKNIDKKKNNIFTWDRGVIKRKNLADIDSEGFIFVTRINPNSKTKILCENKIPENPKHRNLTILNDQDVYLYGDNKIVETEFRVIKTINEKEEPLWFLANGPELSAKEILDIYKRRWDIEVFNRFIKQELNFSHFLSTNINGIKVVLYMTLILSMLILVYKKFNNLGYKTAKRRFYYELDELIMSIAIVLCGGNPELVLRL